MSALPKNHAHYTIAWICALPIEAAAAMAMMDQTHAKLPQPASDHNIYTLGEIFGHSIVLATLPSGSYGTVPAAVVVAQLLSTFPAVQYGMMIGVGGGVPSPENDIRLGDIVVNAPKLQTGGAIQYDFGKILPDDYFQPLGALNQPHPTLLHAATQLRAESTILGDYGIPQVVSQALKTNMQMQFQFSPPKREFDLLHEATYQHISGDDACKRCDPRRRIPRLHRSGSEWPKVHYGIIASGNYVVKDGRTRDRLAQKHNILCFEMEAAGVLNQLPTLIVRGICDYADSHKNKDWQGHAALNAAAYARLLVSKIPSPRLISEPPHQPAFVVPFRRNPRFIGRRKEIEALERLVLVERQTRKAALSGLGGVGKTQIALDLAYRLKSKDSTYSIFWISSVSAEAIEHAYSQIKEQLGLGDVKSGDVKQAVKEHLSQKIHGPWLLIIDNADDINMCLSSPFCLNATLPTGDHGFILFTTRNHQLATRLVGPHVFRIREMEEDTAKVLLTQSLIHNGITHDEKPTAALAQRLNGLPLAIIQAASYINENLISISLYISLLDQKESDAFELLSQDFEDEWRYQEAINPVLTTWLVSFADIQRLNSLAADYLSLVSCLDLYAIPLGLLPPGESPVRQHNALGILKAYSLIDEGIAGDSISNHRLVSLAVRNWLQSRGSLLEWTKKAGERLSTTFPSVTHENRLLWRRFMPHALFLLQSKRFPSDTSDWEEIAWKLGQCFYSDGRYDEAEDLFRKVIERQTGMIGNSRTIDAATWMAATIWSQGRLAEAEKMQAGILNLREWQQHQQDSEVLSGIGNLAVIYMDQGLLAQAEALGIFVMENLQALLGRGHPKTCIAMSNLASIYRQQGRWQAAGELEINVLTMREHSLGPDHPDTINTMNNLATTYTNLGQWVRAKELQTRALNQLKAILPPDHPDVLSTMGNLASILRREEQLDQAESIELQVMKQFQAKFGLCSPKTLTSMANLASTYRDQGRWNEALELELPVVQGLQSLLGQTNPLTLRGMGNLASTYRHLGRLDSAAVLEEDVMNTFQSSLGPDHPDTLTSIGNLSCTYRYQGRLDEAERLATQALEARGRILGAEHPDTLGSMWQLSRTWKTQGKNEAALALLEACVGLHRRHLGTAHPDSIATAAELGEWQSSQ